MAEITGSLTMLVPADGSSFAAGATVDVKAQGTVQVPEVPEGGVQDEYKVTVRLYVFNYVTCDTADQSAINLYKEVWEPRTYDTTVVILPVNGDAYHRATGDLISQKKQPDGTYGPEVALDTKTVLFKIGDPVDCAPRADFCDGTNSPIPGCVQPSPEDGSTVQPGSTAIKQRVRCAVVGAVGCTKKHQFTVVMTVSGPVSQSFTDTEDLNGIGTAWSDVSLQLDLVPGQYTVTTTAKAQRKDSLNPACNQEQFLGAFQRHFSVAGTSSSSTSSSSSSSASSSSSSSSSSASSSSSSSSWSSSSAGSSSFSSSSSSVASSSSSRRASSSSS